MYVIVFVIRCVGVVFCLFLFVWCGFYVLVVMCVSVRGIEFVSVN